MMSSIFEIIHIWTAVVDESEEGSLHVSKFSNLSNWKEEPWKNHCFNEIRTRDPRDAGAMLYQLSYEATHWERGQFISSYWSPLRSEMMRNIYEILRISQQLYYSGGLLVSFSICVTFSKSVNLIRNFTLHEASVFFCHKWRRNTSKGLNGVEAHSRVVSIKADAWQDSWWFLIKPSLISQIDRNLRTIRSTAMENTLTSTQNYHRVRKNCHKFTYSALQGTGTALTVSWEKENENKGKESRI